MPHTRETHPNGYWVAEADVHPETNIAGREARFESGMISPHWQWISPSEGPITHWWFAAVDDKKEPNS